MENSIEYIVLDDSIEYIIIEDSPVQSPINAAHQVAISQADLALQELMDQNPIKNLRMLHRLPIRNEDGYTLNYSYYCRRYNEKMDSSSVETTSDLPAFHCLDETFELQPLDISYEYC
jgi:hypothetical protein